MISGFWGIFAGGFAAGHFVGLLTGLAIGFIPFRKLHSARAKKGTT